jgi:hypothetical protein
VVGSTNQNADFNTNNTSVILQKCIILRIVLLTSLMKETTTSSSSTTVSSSFSIEQLICDLSNFLEQASSPILIYLLTKAQCYLLLPSSASFSSDKSLFSLLDSLWIKIDLMIGVIVQEMDSESVLATSHMDHHISLLNAYCHGVYHLIVSFSSFPSDTSLSTSASSLSTFLEGYFVPFLNIWMYFIIKCFQRYESNAILSSFRINTILQVTESCFTILSLIFSSRFSMILSPAVSTASPSSSSSSIEISVKSLSSWKWYYRFWLLTEICEAKFQDFWNDRILITSHLKSLVRFTIPLYIGESSLLESTKLDLMDEYLQYDKEVLMILSICNVKDIAYLGKKKYASPSSSERSSVIRLSYVTKPSLPSWHDMDFYYHVIYHLEKRRISSTLNLSYTIGYLIESLLRPSHHKR